MSPDHAWFSHALSSGTVWYCTSPTLMLQMLYSSWRSFTAWLTSFGSSVLMSLIPLRRSAIAIVSRTSESNAVLPLYAWACQKMSSGLGFRLGMSSVTWSVRYAMPVLYTVYGTE